MALALLFVLPRRSARTRLRRHGTCVCALRRPRSLWGPISEDRDAGGAVPDISDIMALARRRGIGRARSGPRGDEGQRRARRARERHVMQQQQPREHVQVGRAR